ncbi:class I SAM-dependent methyltransferase [Sorangium sp. So ce394]|uniref:class I SAM-dependent methyltransferase n=1 Tax=Sorangium sp. So ce394 TaxID=3133310 RepID=UPI003F5CB47A
MSMNRIHQWLCASERWADAVERQFLPWALAGVELGGEVLEIGPGYGATTRVLLKRTAALTALETDAALADRLARQLDRRARVVHGDGTAMPFADGSFTGVSCFTMLHHVPSPALQDRLFAEALRVLKPGGIFAGADSMPSLGFRLVHVFDTMVLVDPATLPQRLSAAGFVDIAVEAAPRRAFKFRARKPTRPAAAAHGDNVARGEAG